MKDDQPLPPKSDISLENRKAIFFIKIVLKTGPKMYFRPEILPAAANN